jgi:hypothetical protein
MPNFPRLAFDGSLWAAGDPNLVIENASVTADAIQPMWLHSTCVVYTRDSDGALMCVDSPFVPTSSPRTVRAAGGNVVAAANGKWVIERDDPPVGPRLIFDDGGEWPGYTSPALSDDGSLLACLTQADHTLLAGPTSAMKVMDGAGCLNPRWGSATLCWEKGTGLIYGRTTIDQPIDWLVVPNSRTFKPVPVWTGSALFVLTHTDDRVLLAEWNSLVEKTPRGWVVAGPNFNGGSAYQHDARALNPDAIRVVYGDNGVIQVVDVKGLANPQPIPPGS